ncbi:MAG: M3 family oligoendopeptidase [Gammaproteobacteria bacterium]|nr:M3 family oligoendopeptidase [Gammaproteobacteria bacterium]
MNDTTLEGPAWDLSQEYPAPDSAAIDTDIDALTALLDDIAELNPGLDGDEPVAVAQRLYRLSEQARTLLGDPLTFASCLLSVNSRDDSAAALQGRLQSYQKRFADLLEPLSQFVDLAEDAQIERYLADPIVAPAEYKIRHSRRRRHELLSLPEESLINGLSQDGIHAWGKLYDQLSGTLSCDVLVGNETQTMGIAQAAGLMQKPDVETRRNAWRAINTAWEAHEETCAASINAIAGWRLELVTKRSSKQPVHYLDAPVHMNRISRSTLDTLLDVAKAARPLGQRAARLQARAYGLKTIGPWDQRAPAPDLGEGKASGTPFAAAVETIANAYAQVDPSMGDFVRMMVANGWVEGTQGDSKRPGAYCTGFEKSRTPRVYMTYSGGSSDIITLAHEFGHAFHSWVMRDLPASQRSYGMSLAETASTFGETLVRDALLGSASSGQERLNMAWEEMSALVGFILNIPTRFEFEQRLYEARGERPLLVRELKAMMSEAWTNWYGDALSEPDPLFWANKLHFYISGLSFYNFPYLFGYLFSLGVYAGRAQGGDFYPRYRALLRDTGRMSAEDLATKHLEVDLTRSEFWQNTITSLEGRVDAFEDLLGELGL